MNAENPTRTPDPTLPPLGSGPRRKILIEIEVSADFEKRLDNQWMVEREIHADRWKWRWAVSPHEERAGRMYTAYCAAVGGKAFNGDPLPDWETFRADPAKAKQAEAWIAAAREA
jgi:hypothetical protein